MKQNDLQFNFIVPFVKKYPSLNVTLCASEYAILIGAAQKEKY